MVIGDAEDAFLYHLILRDRADCAIDTNPDSLTGEVRAVIFNVTLWRPEMTDGVGGWENAVFNSRDCRSYSGVTVTLGFYDLPRDVYELYSSFILTIYQII